MKYSLELLAGADLLEGKSSCTLMEQNLKLTTPEYDELFCKNAHDNLLRDFELYRRVVGILLYLKITRPDIAYLVQHLRQFVNAPKKPHVEEAMWVMRYIKQIQGNGYSCSKNRVTSMTAYCDSDWASCSVTKKSVTWYCIQLGTVIVA